MGTPAPLLGRAQELAVLRGHLETTRAGSGRAALVEGEPGVGKTRLAEAATDEAAARGFAVLWGRCAVLATYRETDLPHARAWRTRSASSRACPAPIG
jgi:hypothetical protein